MEKEIINILIESKFKSEIAEIINCLRKWQRNGASIYLEGKSFFCFIKVEDFEKNISKFNDLYYFKNFKYQLNKKEYIVLFWVSSNSTDSKNILKKFIDENNPKKSYYFNDKYNEIRSWTRKYMDLFVNINN
jgi:hypothetical protein